jgi:hypothetical protein
LSYSEGLGRSGVSSDALGYSKGVAKETVLGATEQLRMQEAVGHMTSSHTSSTLPWWEEKTSSPLRVLGLTPMDLKEYPGVW